MGQVHAKGTPEWLDFNKEKLAKAANTLTRLMGGAGLFPVAQERLRNVFRFATNDGGMREAVNVEKRIQAKDTDRFHQDHAAEILSDLGVKLEELPTAGGVQ